MASYIITQINNDTNNEYTKFTAKEEKEILIEYKKTIDINLRNKIIKHNLPLIVKIALNCYYYWKPTSLSIDDLISTGILGIINAINHFDVEKNNKFSTFAFPCIKNKIIDEIYINENIVHVAKNTVKNYKKFSKTFYKLYNEINEKPSKNEIINQSNLSDTEIKFINMIPNDTLSLEELIEKDLLDSVKFEYEQKNPIIELEDLENAIDIIYSTIEDKTIRQILLMKFGFIDGIEHTDQEIADYFHYSRQCISKKISKNLQKIKETL